MQFWLHFTTTLKAKEILMKKTSIKKALSVILSLIFCVSLISSIPYSANATYEAYFLDGTVAKEATFILDPGHGGVDSGALGPVESDGSRREEADANLSMALKVAAELVARGETVALTRITDKEVALIDRSHIANAGNYKIFCSLHRNSDSTGLARGISTFYYNSITSDSAPAKIADKVHNSLMTACPEMTNRGVKNANFSVLRETFTCAILIESLFISNAEDNVLYDSIEDRMAVAIAEGLIESKSVAVPTYMLDDTYKPADLGDSFVAALTLPYANLALTNNGELNTVANTIDYSNSQLWKFEKVDDRNAYKLTSLLDQKCLDIEAAKTDNLTNVMIWDDNGLDCQKYYFYKVNDRYCIRPMHCTNDRVIDINAVSLNAQLYDLTMTNPNQQFKIVLEEDFKEDSSDGSDDQDISADESENKLALVENSTYNLENNIVTKVKINTTAEDFALNFKNNIIIKDIKGNVLQPSDKIGTGYVVTNEDNTDNAEIIILGDIDGNALVSATDYLIIKALFLKQTTLDGPFLTAANVDREGQITATDYLSIKSHFIGLTNIYE